MMMCLVRWYGRRGQKSRAPFLCYESCMTSIYTKLLEFVVVHYMFKVMQDVHPQQRELPRPMDCHLRKGKYGVSTC